MTPIAMGSPLLLILIFLYFLPYLEALCRKKHNRSSILIINLLAGWTIIGWIVAIVLASWPDKPAAPDPRRGYYSHPEAPWLGRR